MKKPHWAPAEIAIARRLIEEGANDEQCIKAVGRNRHACWMKLDNDRKRAASAAFVREANPRPKPEMLAEASRRSLASKSITAFVCGDPAPGMSALDQRENRA